MVAHGEDNGEAFKYSWGTVLLRGTVFGALRMLMGWVEMESSKPATENQEFELAILSLEIVELESPGPSKWNHEQQSSELPSDHCEQENAEQQMGKTM